MAKNFHSRQSSSSTSVFNSTGQVVGPVEVAQAELEEAVFKPQMRVTLTHAGRNAARYARLRKLNRQEKELLTGLAVLFGGQASAEYKGRRMVRHHADK